MAIAFFFSLAVIMPVHAHHLGFYGFEPAKSAKGNETHANSTSYSGLHGRSRLLQETENDRPKGPLGDLFIPASDFLWMYVGFVYLFTGIALYLVITETKKVIRVRQDFLGSQSTITDRTIRLSGIPEKLRSEEKIKETVENLEIGKVERVTLCRNWKELDDLMDKRMGILRKLEEAWTVHLGYKRGMSVPGAQSQASNSDYEHSRLLDEDINEQSHVSSYARDRPMTRIWYGFLGLQSRRIDAIDYYEERLRKLDGQIKSARTKDFLPMPLAFVTLDSTAACVSLTKRG